MAHQYAMRYGHTDDAVPGNLTLNAASDRDAVDQVDKFVKAGYRNGTWATVALTDRDHTARNEHGRVVSA